jgi:hypothetical protein
MIIEMTISTMPDGSNELLGFNYFWLKYVNDFNSAKHCKESLKGKDDERFLQKLVKIGIPYPLNDPSTYKHIYICAEPYKEEERKHLATLKDTRRVAYPYPGLHLALLPEEGSNVSIQTYNGVHITVTNVRRLPIPYLPDGFAGKGHLFTGCCIWQFGVEYYGLTE